jgi:hypothetical protein
MGFTGSASVIASHAALRLHSHSTDQTAFVMGASAAPDGGGGTYVYVASDTSSGCLFTGSVSGTTLTVSSVTNGALGIGLSINRSDTGVTIGTIVPPLGTGTGGTGTYNLSASASIAGPFGFTADSDSSFIVATDGGRWFNVGYCQRTVAEASAGVTPTNYGYPPGNVLRYGIVPNSVSAAGTNTTILQAVLNYFTAGPTGTICFPNTTGADIYSFAAIPITVRQFVRIDLGGCTLSVSGNSTANDVNTGFFYALSDVTIENGTITTAVNTALGDNAAACVALGARGSGHYYTVFDSTQGTGKSLGRIILRNLVLSNNNTGGESNAVIQILGGMSNVLFENININCNNAMSTYALVPSAASASQSGVTFSTVSQIFTAGLLVYLTGTAPGGFSLNTPYYVSATGLTATTCELSLTPGGSAMATTSSASCIIHPATGVGGIYYEWGWATSPSGTATTQTSHGHNMRFSNIRIVNCVGTALGLTGCYNAIVDGLYTANCTQTFVYSVGEAMFYNPWVGVDQYGAKRNIAVSNVVAQGTITGPAIQLAGSNLGSDTYLGGAGVVFTPAQQTDLMTFTLDNLAVSTLVIGGSTTARNCKIDAGGVFFNPLTINDDCIFADFTNMMILNGTGSGVRADVAGISVWAPIRQKYIAFRGGLVAGNQFGFELNSVRAARLTDVRIGYNALYDGQGNEATQSIGVLVSSGCNGVVADSCFVTTSGGAAYSITGVLSSGCNVINPQGTVTTANQWDHDGISVTIQANIANKNSYPNMGYKYLGKKCLNTNNNHLYVAQGPLNTDAWIPVDTGDTGGPGTITPV